MLQFTMFLISSITERFCGNTTIYIRGNTLKTEMMYTIRVPFQLSGSGITNISAFLRKLFWT